MSEPTEIKPASPAAIAWGRILEKWRGLSRPARILLFSTLAAAVVIGLFIAARSAYAPYSVLYSELEREDAAAIAAKLKELKAEYRITGEGTTIEVPEEQVHELRLALANEGLPRGGSVGFESFEGMRLGATEFEQQVTYRRAMEGELARTIATIAAVQTARVHIVLPEKSVFTTKSDPATASIVVKLKPGRSLSKEEVAGVVHLVSSGVTGLSPDAVALVTTEGEMLHRPKKPGENTEEMAAVDPDQLARTRALEASLEARAQTMLEKVLGAGKANVRISAELDLARMERTEDRYEPAKTALRSEEQLIETTTSQGGDAAGVPGAESNLPSEEEDYEGGDAAQGVVRKQHTRNWEIDHVAEKRVVTSGSVRRLTVAVVVDGLAGDAGAIVPREREELDRLAALVGGAVGLDQSRGDVLTIESFPFAAEVIPEAGVVAEAAPVVPEEVKRYWPIAAGAVGLLGLVLAIRAVRASRKRRATLAEEQDIAQLKSAEAAALRLTPAKPVVSDREEAIRRATHDPATAAMVMRHWLGMADETASKAA